MKTDYYRVLDVDADATLEQIKSAYRNMAKQFHPDRFQGGDAPFREVQEAYEVLCDADRRRSYDEELRRTKSGSPSRSSVEALSRHRPMAEPLVPTRPSPIAMDDFFDSHSSYQGSPAREGRWYTQRRPQAKPAQQVRFQIAVSPQQAYYGGCFRLWLPLEIECPVCGGWGRDWYSACGHCLGRGQLIEESPVEIVIPAHMRDGTIARFSLSRPGRSDVHLTLQFRIGKL
jgi:DnaJ-class molecular chaperone